MRVLTLVLLAAVLAGCSPGEEPSNPTGNPPGDGAAGTSTDVTEDGGAAMAVTDPCQVISQDEAAAAAGNPVQPGNLLGVICIWEPTTLNDTSVQVSLGLVPIAAGADADAVCDAGLAGIPEAQPFPGIGDRAFWDFDSAAGGNSGSLHVCVEQGFVDTAAIGGRSESELQEIAVSLANTALDRI